MCVVLWKVLCCQEYYKEISGEGKARFTTLCKVCVMYVCVCVCVCVCVLTDPCALNTDK